MDLEDGCLLEMGYIVLRASYCDIQMKSLMLCVIFPTTIPFKPEYSKAIWAGCDSSFSQWVNNFTRRSANNNQNIITTRAIITLQWLFVYVVLCSVLWSYDKALYIERDLSRDCRWRHDLYSVQENVWCRECNTGICMGFEVHKVSPSKIGITLYHT